MNGLSSRIAPRTIVVALNPSVDVEWSVPEVVWEEKNSVMSERRWAGGKGVNVARWVRHLGGQSVLILPLGGATGREMIGCLETEKLPARVISLRQATRANIIVTTAAGSQLRFNPLGPRVTRIEWRHVVETIGQLVRSLPRKILGGAVVDPLAKAGPAGNGGGKTSASPCLVLSGSLPRGLRPSAYAQLVRLVQRAGVRALLDCDGPAFKLGIKARPFLVKPNVHELEQWMGRRLPGSAGLLTAARALSRITQGWVLVSQGAVGALLVNAKTGQYWRASAPPVKAVNTIGAGDALLAAVACQIEDGAPAPEWLRWGVATGTAATRCEAGRLPSPVLIRRLARQTRVE